MMIHQDIPRQARLFLMAAAAGIGMLFVYDLFRIFRRVAKHGTVWIAIEDMFFWAGSAFWLFHFMYRQNDGIIRGFVILGVFAGMLVYSLGCSRWVVRAGTAILRFAVKIVSKIAGILFVPFRFAGRRLGGGMKRTGRRLGGGMKRTGRRLGGGMKCAGRMWKKNRRIMKKRLKKVCKAVKMGLCKL